MGFLTINREKKMYLSDSTITMKCHYGGNNALLFQERF
jgi:hypothetical protein